ncbi:MAG: amidase family protein [Chromatiales bacterium]|jgi:amidase|nr:amidase family protein [Chromatiales bacterium]
MTQLWQLDAVELARLIRTRQVSCEEVVAAHLARMDQVNPTLNAVVLSLENEARTAAAEADRAVARGDPIGPLHGVPVTTKVNIDQAGCPTDNGVHAYRNVIATEDSPTVANLRKAGAVFLGRTNTPAFSMRWFTENELHGNTLNPWDVTRTAGGSSGGAASSVASGMVPIGQGNDIAGSVRYPAYCCGLVGLRPSYGRAPTYNPSVGGAGRPITAQLMAVQGPLTRSVRDARVAMQVMSVGDIRDPKWVDVPFEGAPLCRPIRVAMVDNPAGRGVAEPVRQAVLQAGRWLENAGYKVESVEPPELGRTADLWAELAIDDTIRAMQSEVDKHGDEGIKRAVGYWSQGAPRRGPQGVLDALMERERLLRAWEDFMEQYPLVLMPSCTEQAFPVGLDANEFTDYQRIWASQLPQLAIPVLGVPAITVPTGLHDGLPLGVQLSARRYREDVCLAAAEIIEAQATIQVPVVDVASGA